MGIQLPVRKVLSAVAQSCFRTRDVFSFVLDGLSVQRRILFVTVVRGGKLRIAFACMLLFVLKHFALAQRSPAGPSSLQGSQTSNPKSTWRCSWPHRFRRGQGPGAAAVSEQSVDGLSSATDGLEDAGGSMMSGGGFGQKLLPGRSAASEDQSVLLRANMPLY